jgi:hypothetical protein
VERKPLMNTEKRKWNVTIVDVFVGFAVLMILSALIVPIFVPPEGRAAVKAAATRTVTTVTRH